MSNFIIYSIQYIRMPILISSTLFHWQVYPHQYTEDPTVAWEMLKSKRPVKLVRPMKLDSAVKMDHVRFVCIACSHGTYIDPKTVPGGDVLIVAGDFTSCGLPKEIKSFNENLGRLYTVRYSKIFHRTDIFSSYCFNFLFKILHGSHCKVPIFSIEPLQTKQQYFCSSI